MNNPTSPRLPTSLKLRGTSRGAREAGILFDYNGVIVDDEHLQEQALADICANHGVSLTHELYVTHCLGRPDRELFQNLGSVFKQLTAVPVEELVNQKVRRYRHLIEEKSILFPGFTKTLQLLHTHFALAVVTGSLRSEIEPILAEENIASFFEAVITADDISRGKPNPEGYLKGIRALNLPPEKIVVIEDTPRGIEAAKAAGLKCIAVCHTVDASHLKQADIILPTVNDVTPDVVWSMVKNE
jgi:beta-phosphoglucomutase